MQRFWKKNLVCPLRQNGTRERERERECKRVRVHACSLYLYRSGCRSSLCSTSMKPYPPARDDEGSRRSSRLLSDMSNQPSFTVTENHDLVRSRIIRGFLEIVPGSVEGWNTQFEEERRTATFVQSCEFSGKVQCFESSTVVSKREKEKKKNEEIRTWRLLLLIVWTFFCKVQCFVSSTIVSRRKRRLVLSRGEEEPWRLFIQSTNFRRDLSEVLQRVWIADGNFEKQRLARWRKGKRNCDVYLVERRVFREICPSVSVLLKRRR